MPGIILWQLLFTVSSWMRQDIFSIICVLITITGMDIVERPLRTVAPGVIQLSERVTPSHQPNPPLRFSRALPVYP